MAWRVGAVTAWIWKLRKMNGPNFTWPLLLFASALPEKLMAWMGKIYSGRPLAVKKPEGSCLLPSSTSALEGTSARTMATCRMDRSRAPPVRARRLRPFMCTGRRGGLARLRAVEAERCSAGQGRKTKRNESTSGKLKHAPPAPAESGCGGACFSLRSPGFSCGFAGGTPINTRPGGLSYQLRRRPNCKRRCPTTGEK